MERIGHGGYVMTRERGDSIWRVYFDDEKTLAFPVRFRTSIEARNFIDVVNAERAANRRAADRIDGYDRDDLGESPDY